MKKIIVLITVFIMIFVLGACSQQKNNPQKTTETVPRTQTPAPQQQTPTPQSQTPAPQTQDFTKASIGNIHLGDSKEDVIKAFGKDYKETYEEDAAMLGESFYRWVYDRGITLIIGKNTNQVLEMHSTDPSLVTNLGVKIGDTYETVSKKYGNYKVMKSNQDNSELAGWYVVGEGQLVIFDFDKNDNAAVNKNVKPDSKVEKIEITYQKFVD